MSELKPSQMIKGTGIDDAYDELYANLVNIKKTLELPAHDNIRLNMAMDLINVAISPLPSDSKDIGEGRCPNCKTGLLIGGKGGVCNELCQSDCDCDDYLNTGYCNCKVSQPLPTTVLDLAENKQAPLAETVFAECKALYLAGTISDGLMNDIQNLIQMTKPPSENTDKANTVLPTIDEQMEKLYRELGGSVQDSDEWSRLCALKDTVQGDAVTLVMDNLIHNAGGRENYSIETQAEDIVALVKASAPDHSELIGEIALESMLDKHYPSADYVIKVKNKLLQKCIKAIRDNT